MGSVLLRKRGSLSLIWSSLALPPLALAGRLSGGWSSDQSHIYAASHLDRQGWTCHSQGKAPCRFHVDALTPLSSQQPFPRVAAQQESSGLLFASDQVLQGAGAVP